MYSLSEPSSYFEENKISELFADCKYEIHHIDFSDVKLDNIPLINEFCETELEKMDAPMKAVMQINIAIDEIYSNIVKFAYKGANGGAAVLIYKSDEENAAKVIFVDSGYMYNPLEKKDPDITLSAEERDIGGLGIFMVKKSMDAMEYRYENNKNILILTKKIGE